MIATKSTTVGNLRDKAKSIGLTGYSRMRRADLIAALTTVKVHRGDLKVTRKLGAAYLRTCTVGEWRNKGTTRNPYWQPLSWLVPAGILARYGCTPISQEEAEARRAEMSARAKASYRSRYNQACDRIGAIYGSRTAHALVQGQIDADLAELIAFRASYRHEFTNYDELIRESKDRDFAREEMAPTRPIPDSWSVYLARYGFRGEVAEALAKTLQDPACCHPVWFTEAQIAVRRTGLDLDDLTYEDIREAISQWRDERYEG